MKYLITLALVAVALMAANFATVAPAQADSFGFQAGRGGFGIYVNNYDDRYYGHRYRRGCYTRWDYRNNWRCRRYNRSYYNDSYDYPYYSYYNSYPRYRYNQYPRYRYNQYPRYRNDYRSNRHDRHDDRRRHRW